MLLLDGRKRIGATANDDPRGSEDFDERTRIGFSLRSMTSHLGLIVARPIR